MDRRAAKLMFSMASGALRNPRTPMLSRSRHQRMDDSSLLGCSVSESKVSAFSMSRYFA